MSRDIKGTSLNELNDGLERAINRLNLQLRDEIIASERNAINEAALETRRQIVNVRAEMSKRMQGFNDSLTQRIEESQRNLGARIDQQAKESARMLVEADQRHTAEIKKLEKQVFDAIEQQNQDFSQEIKRIDNNVNVLSKGLNTVKSQLQRVEKEVEDKLSNHQRQIDSMRVNIQRLFDERDADLNRKLLAAGEALAFLEIIKERTDTRRFAPKHMQEHVALLAERIKNIRQHPEMCTITDVNNLIDAAVLMENEAIREQMRWEAQYHSTATAVNALLRMMQQSMKLKVNSIYDESQPEELATDYWTHGEYGRIEQEVKSLKGQLDKRQMSLEEMRHLNERIELLERKGDALRREAVHKGILSESRVAVSNDILNAMISQGWELKDDPGFLGGDTSEDMREGTFAILKKTATDEELSIIILPEEIDGCVKNKIIFHRNDNKIESPGAFQARMEQIKREIEKSGHKLGALGEPPCGGDGKVPQLADSKKLKEKGAADVLNRTIHRIH